MSGIIPFDFEGHQVRVVVDEAGQQHWVGKDVCDALGFKDHNAAMRDHCKGVRKSHPLQTAGGMQELRVINEPDVYRLAAGCSLPAGDRFERWVFEEVIPSIRKNGYYAMGSGDSPLLSQLAHAMSSMGEAIARVINRLDAMDASIDARVHSIMATHRVTARYGETAGQAWKRLGFETKGMRGAAVWFGNRLAELGCFLIDGGRAELGGQRARLFDPDAVDRIMRTTNLRVEIGLYIAGRQGQSKLFVLVPASKEAARV